MRGRSAGGAWPLHFLSLPTFPPSEMFFPPFLLKEYLLNLQGHIQMLPDSRSSHDFFQMEVLFQNSHKLPEHPVVFSSVTLNIQLQTMAIGTYIVLSFILQALLCQTYYRETRKTEISSTLSLGLSVLNLVNERRFECGTALQYNYRSRSEVYKGWKLILLV